MKRLEESQAGEIKEMLSTILWEEHKMIPQEWQLELAIRTTLGLLTYSRGGDSVSTTWVSRRACHSEKQINSPKV